ncbi:hypothetical protein FNV43_RR08669 [Rhamnella rubrinervis]|uniref:Non-specific lipid-transfer protein n=1 Tax=Rhamnella rubrinervis TaxID=2594499 RepID=A0A8K0H8M7_9ROSA|nr:hypothetical protein FNV43_RR08669 [Rhamnella rubrinervis]
MAGLTKQLLVCILVVTFMAVIIAPSKARAEVTCDVVNSYLKPCSSYVEFQTSTVPGDCCSGINNLNGVAQTTQDRQSVCKCLIRGVSKVPSFIVERAGGIPAKLSNEADINYGANQPLEVKKVYVVV